MPICIICDKEFTAQRSDAKICSDKCRQQAHRSGISARKPKKPAPAPISSIEAFLSLGRPQAPEEPRKPAEPTRKFDGISRITHVSKEEMDKRIAEGIDRVQKGMAELAAYPTDYNDLLRLAKAGGTDKDLFRKHVDSLKLTPNQKSMIYSKLK